jgi:DNA helicase IV
LPDSHPELAAEQRHLDAAYARLDAMRDAARRVAEGFAEVGRGGTHQARLEREAAEDLTRRRLAALDIGDAPLCFGRLDLTAGAPSGNGAGNGSSTTHSNGANGSAAADANGRAFHIGRISVADEEQTPLVVDWRAPVAEPFYRATAVEPMDVVRRRHFLTKPGDGRVIVGIDDEVFDQGAADSDGLTVIGEGALLAALDRARTGRMGDIVATIQAEQDQAIRAPLPGALVVAGGAGTGKTAVALHRAAYLLYTYRSRLASQGVLLVGPNTIFLRYIDQVLPSLGESEVSLATPAGLKPSYRVSASDPPEVAKVKGDARMAQVVANALRDREHPLAQDLMLRLDGITLRLRRGASARIVERAAKRRGTHNEKRPAVARAVVDHLRSQYRGALGASAPDDADWDREIDSRIRRAPEVRAAIDRMWPVLSGAELIHDLFSFAALVRSAADGVLSRGEQRGLDRRRATSVRDVAWTEADLALVDEADALLGSPGAAKPRRRRKRGSGVDETAAAVVANLGVGGMVSASEVARRYAGDPAPVADDDEPRTFAHVLVDEAQDLSAMQWRMLARRCPSGSMTLVGDFGQASRPGAVDGWDAVLALLPDQSPPQHVTLSVNYRTPSEIMDVAHRVLAAAAPGVVATRAVRSTGEHPRFESVGRDELLAAVGAEVRAAIHRTGTVAVIAPDDLHDALVAELADVGAVADSVEALDAPVAVLGPWDAKGLEFDEVVVVEPSRLVPPDRAGLRLLYVALTRATRHLVVVHAEALPEALVTAPSSAGSA